MPTVEYEQLRIAEEIGRLGSYIWDLETDEVTWSRGLYRLLEIPESVKATFALWMSLVDQEYLPLAMSRRTKGAERLHEQEVLEYPMHPIEDLTIWVRVKSRPVMVHGRPSVVGICQDITTARRQRDEITTLNGQLVSMNAQLSDMVQLLNAERFFPRR